MIKHSPPDLRQEVKFVCSSVHLSTILQWIKCSQEDFYIQYPDRWVNNIYFDTFDYKSYVENEAGIGSRSKVRYRWYDEREIGPGLLEVKQKVNVYNWKTSFDIRQIDVPPGSSPKKLKEIVDSHLPLAGRLWLENFSFPVIRNKYYRTYYSTRDGNIRLTIDRNHKVWDVRYRLPETGASAVNTVDSIIVELKFSKEFRDRGSLLIDGFPIRPSRHSKYMVGVNAANWL